MTMNACLHYARDVMMIAWKTAKKTRKMEGQKQLEEQEERENVMGKQIKKIACMMMTMDAWNHLMKKNTMQKVTSIKRRMTGITFLRHIAIIANQYSQMAESKKNNVNE